MAIAYNQNQELSLKERFFNLNFVFIFILILLAAIGCLTLYSAAGGKLTPWALNQGIRFGLGIGVMLVAAMIRPEFYYKIAPLFYFFTLFLLLVVDIAGHTGMGAQRWINLGFFKLQPSELMKLAIVLQLARYFSNTSYEEIRTIRGIIIPLIIVAVPVMPKDGKTHTEFIAEAEKLERVDRALGAFSALKLPAKTIVLLLDNTKLITGNPTISGYFAKVDTENGAEWFTLYNIVIKGSAEDQKGEETYRALNALLEEYFDNNYQFGMMVGVNDMRVGTPRDFAIVSGILAAISVILCILLLASLRKGIAVALLSMLALFVNLAISTLLGESINFIIYLLIGAVQLGYSVDTALFVLYAPRRNREGEEGMLARLVAEEEERCLRWKPIVTSLCVLLAVTLSVYFVSANLVVQDMAMLMARGGVIACFVQLFFLPALAGSTTHSRFWRKQKLS